MSAIIFYKYSLRQVEEYLKTQDGIVLRAEEYDIASVRELIASSKTVPGKKKIVFFAKAEKLSEGSQNALLKEMEDSNDVEFVFLSTRRLIPTVESRSQINEKEQMSEDEFAAVAELFGTPQKDAEWLYAFCDGDPETLKDVANDERLYSIISRFAATPFDKKKEILETFSMLREKDKSSFFTSYREWIPSVLQLILHLLVNKAAGGEEVEKSLIKVETHLRLIESPSYSTNDFFDLLVGI